jgi:hypothetical protein
MVKIILEFCFVEKTLTIENNVSASHDTVLQRTVYISNQTLHYRCEMLTIGLSNL